MKLNKKLINKVVIFIMTTLFLISCGTDNVVSDSSIIPEYNKDVMKVVTWNLKEFPLSSSTVNDLQHLVTQLNADVIAVQEVTSTADFAMLGTFLNDYSVLFTEDYIYDPNDEESYFNPVLGFIYNNTRVTINNSYEIFYEDSRLFPREPYILEFSWENNDFVLINNHLKAGGDNQINEYYEWDEETRRRDALNALHDYAIDDHANDNVMIVGDFNDQFHEPIETNVFTSFNNDDNFVYADYEMSLDTDDFSYPNWPSHLDHIIINNNLFDTFGKNLSDCYTLKYDKTVSSYFSNISDHRPVMIQLDYSN